MTRTNIDIDDKAIDAVMRRYRFRTKREAVDFALRSLVVPVLSVGEALALEGSGWEGELDSMRHSSPDA